MIGPWRIKNPLKFCAGTSNKIRRFLSGSSLYVPLASNWVVSQKTVGAAFCTFRLSGDSRCAANAVVSGNPFCQEWT
jgi:hypothetical protein